MLSVWTDWRFCTKANVRNVLPMGRKTNFLFLRTGKQVSAIVVMASLSESRTKASEARAPSSEKDFREIVQEKSCVRSDQAKQRE